MIIILGTDHGGESVIAKLLASTGAFLGEGSDRATASCPQGAGVNVPVHELCTVPYLRRYLPIKRVVGKGKTVTRFNLEKAMIPYEQEMYFPKPPYFRERVQEILRRQECDIDKVVIWSPWNIRMASVWTAAFPEADIVLVKPTKKSVEDRWDKAASEYLLKCIAAVEARTKAIVVNTRDSNKPGRSIKGLRDLMKALKLDPDDTLLRKTIDECKHTFTVKPNASARK